MTYAPELHRAAATRDAVVDVTILSTTDLHAHLFPFNYYTDRRDNSVGLARIAAAIQDRSTIRENRLLLDNGDTLYGAPLGDMNAELCTGGRGAHPMVAAMNALGYDAATLGNHDFDFGLQPVDKAVADADFPVVLANASRPDGAAYLPRHVILRRTMTDRNGQSHDLRIGLIGVAPPQIAQWHKAILGKALMWGDMVDAVRRELAAIRSSTDLCVVLAHSGIGETPPPHGTENAAGAIARLRGVDAVVAGHTHRVIARGKRPDAAPIVQPGYWGSHLGQVTLTLGRDPSRDTQAWRVKAAAVDVCAMTPDPPRNTAALRRSLQRMPQLRAQLRREHRATRAWAGKVIGRTEARLNSYFAMVGRSGALDVVAAAKRAMTARHVAHEPGLRDLPILAAVAPFKAGGRGGAQHFTDIPPGALRLRHAADLYVFPNFLTVVKTTGANVRQWVETSAAVFETVDPSAQGDTWQPLLPKDFASYNFDVMYGLTYTIDLRASARPGCTCGRVRNLAFADGRPVRDRDEILVATNNFRATGGGGFAAAARSETVIATTDPIRDCVAAYLKDQGTLAAAEPEIIWRFAPLGDIPVAFPTGPGAREDDATRAALDLIDLGPTETGFHRFGVRL